LNPAARFPPAAILLLASTLLALSPTAAPAVEKRVLEFESDPTGAEVFLLQGTRKVPVGKTPVRYPAEFHSAVSVLRFLVRKPGWEPKTVELGAGESRVVVKLPRRRFTADPESLSRPELRKLQERLRPAIEGSVANVPPARGPLTFDVTPPIRVATFDGGVYLVVPVYLQAKGECGSRSSPRENQDDVRRIWEQAGSGITGAFAGSLAAVDARIGILLDMVCVQAQAGFSVAGALETTVEMQCFPGMVEKQVWDYCARKVPDPSYPGDSTRTKCEGGFVSRLVHDPCAYKEPVSRTSMKATPTTTVGSARRRVQFVLTPSTVAKAAAKKDVFDMTGRLLISESGVSLLRQGDLPSGLPEIP